MVGVKFIAEQACGRGRSRKARPATEDIHHALEAVQTEKFVKVPDGWLSTKRGKVLEERPSEK